MLAAARSRDLDYPTGLPNHYLFAAENPAGEDLLFAWKSNPCRSPHCALSYRWTD